MTFEVCILDSDYEISNVYPYPIRRIGSNKIIGESIDDKGYVSCHLNGKTFRKHVIVARQFIPNPDNLPCIDHINRDRSDFHIENLRWVTRTENNMNKSSNRGIEYEFIDELPEDSIDVNEYGNHTFEFYYYSESEDSFYYYTGINYRKLHVCFHSQRGPAYVQMIDINDKRVALLINKFKKLYDLQF